MKEYLWKTHLLCVRSLLGLVETYDITRQVATLEEKAVDALEWSAAPVVGCSHITNEEEQADFASLLRRSN